MQTVTAPELAAWLADEAREKPVLLDVREPWEFQTCHIAGAVPIPMHDIPARMQELDEDAPVVCICHHGMRSMSVASFLERNGFTHVVNLTGGVHAWALEVDHAMPTY